MLVPNKWKAGKTDFGVFEGFFHLYAPQKRRKKDTSLDFARFCGACKSENLKKSRNPLGQVIYNALNYPRGTAGICT